MFEVLNFYQKITQKSGRCNLKVMPARKTSLYCTIREL